MFDERLAKEIREGLRELRREAREARERQERVMADITGLQGTVAQLSTDVAAEGTAVAAALAAAP